VPAAFQRHATSAQIVLLPAPLKAGKKVVALKGCQSAPLKSGSSLILITVGFRHR
jgi:hypothetical protein